MLRYAIEFPWEEKTSAKSKPTPRAAMGPDQPIRQLYVQHRSHLGEQGSGAATSSHPAPNRPIPMSLDRVTLREYPHSHIDVSN